MQVASRIENRVTILSPVGSLDALTAPVLANAFRECFSAGQVRLVADLAELDFLSSAGMRVLLSAAKEARANGGELRLAAANAEVNEILDLGGFPSIIKMFETTDGAVASFAA